MLVGGVRGLVYCFSPSTCCRSIYPSESHHSQRQRGRKREREREKKEAWACATWALGTLPSEIAIVIEVEWSKTSLARRWGSGENGYGSRAVRCLPSEGAGRSFGSRLTSKIVFLLIDSILHLKYNNNENTLRQMTKESNKIITKSIYPVPFEESVKE